jgi:glycosyltransferase involved in cell wall biosynthesis
VQTLTGRLATVARRPWPDDPVPVSLVITELDVGGAERALVALATHLDRRRWRPSVIALGPEGPLAGPLRAEGLATVCLGVDPRRRVDAVRRLARALRDQAPRLVQSFLFHANVATRLAAPLAGSPWVVNGHRVAERRARRYLTLDRLTERLALGAVCVSRGVLRFMRDVAGLSPDRLVVIPNGVDLGPIDRAKPLARAALGVPEGALLALCVGRLTDQKGLPILLEAAERVAAARPDWHLALVGDGPDREALRRLAARSGTLAGRVHWLGLRGDVPALLKTADVFVLPSLWEGMPNVVLEAMAARLAVVATAVEGTEEAVIPGKTGWLVPPGDPESLGRTLLEAADHPERRRRFGDAGRARVEAEFTLRRMVDAYQRLWAGILGLELGPQEPPP